jgi:hypothetical protein
MILWQKIKQGAITSFELQAKDVENAVLTTEYFDMLCPTFEISASEGDRSQGDESIH